MLNPSRASHLSHLENRVNTAKRSLERVKHIEARYPWLRLAGLIAALLFGYLAASLLPIWAAGAIILLLLAGFIALTRAHQRVILAVDRYQALLHLAEDRLGRAQLDWSHLPAHFPIPVSAEHPFNADLMITGARSIHALMDCCISAGGSRQLASWLLETQPELTTAVERQLQVQELLRLPTLRRRLSLAGILLSRGETRWDGDALLEWLSRGKNDASLRSTLISLSILALINLILLLCSSFFSFPPYWIATLLFYLGIQAYHFRESSESFGQSLDLARRLEALRQLLSPLEDHPFKQAPRVAEICATIRQGQQRPSQILRVASRITTAASLRNNPFLSVLLNLLVPWDVFFAYQLEKLQARLSVVLPQWLDSLYRVDALCSLAEFAALNPTYIFPTFTTEEDRPLFHAKGLGHPLLPYETRVSNDFQLDRPGDAVLITGSNMSGKSTFLRTLGVTLCLASAGSVVAAEGLDCRAFRVFTSMNIADSLSDGISYFYAEVRRLKMVLDALQVSEPGPVFYLIDEIFRGTNNRERRIGSEAYLRALLNEKGIGVISTHDLELAKLADEIVHLRNGHFREEISGDRMVFDYHLRNGASPTTNALRIMALAGLPIPPDSLKN